MAVKYIAKPNTFFDPGTEAVLVEQVSHRCAFAHFRGIHYGEMKVQLCRFDEFEQKWSEDDASEKRV